MSDRPPADVEDPPTEADSSSRTDHLIDVPDGSGCTEIWEHLSERRSGEEE